MVIFSTISLLIAISTDLCMVRSLYLTSLGAYDKQAVLKSFSTTEVSLPGCIHIKQLWSIEMGNFPVSSINLAARMYSFMIKD